jgi:hypothetical protein
VISAEAELLTQSLNLRDALPNGCGTFKPISCPALRRRRQAGKGIYPCRTISFA